MKLTKTDIITLRAMFSQLKQSGVTFDSEEWRLIHKISGGY